MSTFETFVAFREGLDPAARDALDAKLAHLMGQDDEVYKLSPEQRAEVRRRLADPNPEYVPWEKVKAELKREFDIT